MFVPLVMLVRQARGQGRQARGPQAPAAPNCSCDSGAGWRGRLHPGQGRPQNGSVPGHGGGGCTGRYRPSLTLEQRQLSGRGMGAMLAVGMAFGCVVAVVAALAECGEVVGGVVGRVVVEVGGGEDDDAAGLGMGQSVRGAAPFAAAAGAPEADTLADGGPVLGVEVFQGWMDRHCLSFTSGRWLPAGLTVRSDRTAWPWPIGPRPRGGCSGPACVTTASGRSP